MRYLWGLILIAASAILYLLAPLLGLGRTADEQVAKYIERRDKRLREVKTRQEAGLANLQRQVDEANKESKNAAHSPADSINRAGRVS
jgi:hypothetical protein